MRYNEREYRPAPRNDSGNFRKWNVTNWLIAINIAVYVIDYVTHRMLTWYGFFSAQMAVGHLQLWRFLTFQFLHANLNHIFFNMLALYFFGPMVEQYLGKGRYLAFYLLCGMAGAASYLFLMFTHIIHETQITQLVGASAGIFGVLIASTRVAPDARVMLLFPPIPMKLRTLAWVMIGIAVFTVFYNGHNAGGEAAHLGGAALGFILIQRPQVLNVFAKWLR